MLKRVIVILTFRRRPDRLIGRAESSTAHQRPANQLLRLHGIDAPDLDQTFLVAGPACGAMSLAALEALIAGVKVRCEVVERDR